MAQQRFSIGVINGEVLIDEKLTAVRQSQSYQQTLNPGYDVGPTPRPWVSSPGLATDCVYPVGRWTLTWIFCGGEVVPGHPYCSKHLKACYISDGDKGKR